MMGNLLSIEAISFLASITQLADYNLDVKQVSNDVLLKELQRQDKEYLDKIIANQKAILKKLDALAQGG